MSNTFDIAELKIKRNQAIRSAEKLAYDYACCCPIGDEREKAFEIYENIRTSARVY